MLQHARLLDATLPHADLLDSILESVYLHLLDVHLLDAALLNTHLLHATLEVSSMLTYLVLRWKSSPQVILCWKTETRLST